MKLLKLFIVFFTCTYTLQAQYTDKDFTVVYNKINGQKFYQLDRSADNYFKDSTEIIEINQLLQFLNTFLNQELKLNGRGSFNFGGNESDLNNLFRIGVGASIDKGLYPFELDFSTGIQTIVQNGVFQENLSDIDISVDFHPIIPKIDAKNDGLWLENYVFVKRFNDAFLGIEQRYEVGGGFTFNFFNSNLTKSGKDNETALNSKPTYNVYGEDLIRCMESCFKTKNILSLTSSETETISNTRERYLRANKKKYSKLRLAMLVGLNYEIEKAQAQNIVRLNGRDTLLQRSFDATNRLRWQIRPTIKWQPKDGYTFRLYPYLKLPLGNMYDTVIEDGNMDKRFDYFLDLHSSFDIAIEKNFSIRIFYRLLYDNAPKRAFIKQEEATYVLLEGQTKHSAFGVSLNFGF